MNESGKLPKEAKTKGQLAFDMISYLLTLQNDPVKWTKAKEKKFKVEGASLWIPLEVYRELQKENKQIERVLKELCERKDDKIEKLEAGRMLESITTTRHTYLHGILIFKWHESDKKLSQIKQYFPCTPLFGQKTNTSKGRDRRPAYTWWFCFMKKPKSVRVEKEK